MTIVPTVHLNGTSKNELLQQLRDAAMAVQAARDVVAKAAPHQRDYYMRDPDDWRQAREIHQSWLGDLDRMNEQIVNIYVGVEDQGR